MTLTSFEPILPAQPRGLHAVVVGGGTMGADVAIVLARGGCRVTVTEPQPAQREALQQRVQAALDDLGLGHRAAHLDKAVSRLGRVGQQAAPVTG